MTAQTVCPEGVIARYLTLAGAPVDITHASHSSYVIATCSGCGQDDYTPTGGRASSTPEEETWRVDQVLPESCGWAQTHAETCQAVPAPTA